MTATTAPATQVQPRQSPWWLTLINGILALFVSSALLWGALDTKKDVYMTLIWFIGFYWLFRGIFDLVYMFIDHSQWGWKLFMGIVGIMAGSYILQYPLASALVLPKIFVWVLGFWGIMEGIILLIMAFQGGGWGAGILGALAIIFGIALLNSYDQFGMGLAFVWTAAVLGVVGGIFLIYKAFQVKKAQKAVQA
jgi:uncharacterized membrane protein HdeD (DUF308 family)